MIDCISGREIVPPAIVQPQLSANVAQLSKLKLLHHYRRYVHKICLNWIVASLFRNKFSSASPAGSLTALRSATRPKHMTACASCSPLGRCWYKTNSWRTYLALGWHKLPSADKLRQVGSACRRLSKFHTEFIDRERQFHSVICASGLSFPFAFALRGILSLWTAGEVADGATSAQAREIVGAPTVRTITGAGPDTTFGSGFLYYGWGLSGSGAIHRDTLLSCG